MVIGLLLREGGREERGGERSKYMHIRIISDNHAVTPVQIVGGIIIVSCHVQSYLPKPPHTQRGKFLSGLLCNPGTSCRQSSWRQR